MVPVRDQCFDPRAPSSTKVPVSRDDTGCVLHIRSGPVRYDGEQCARLQCEPGVGSTFARTRPGIVALLVAIYGLGMIAWAARWRALLAFAGVDLALWQVMRMSVEAQAVGVLVPGGVGGDAMRVASVLARPARPGEARAPAALVVASVLLDRAVGLSVLAALAAALGFATGGLRAGPLAVALAAIPVACAAGVALLRALPLERALPQLTRGRVGAAIAPVLAYVRDPRAPRAIVVAAALSLLVAAAQILTVRGFVFALGGAPTAERWIYVGTAMAFIVAAFPALPGGWGTTDAAYVYFFGLAGLPAGTALAVCLLYRLFWYLSGVAGAVLHVTRSRVTTRAATTSVDPAGEPPA
jgi:uncharacterized membrane protein YbhN (UPF0104 family)